MGLATGYSFTLIRTSSPSRTRWETLYSGPVGCRLSCGRAIRRDGSTDCGRRAKSGGDLGRDVVTRPTPTAMAFGVALAEHGTVSSVVFCASC